MNFLMADFSASQWIVLSLILALIVLYPFFVAFKNRKERERFEQITGSLKVGDKVITSSGIVGEIVAISEEPTGKMFTLKTGDDNHVGYIKIDILAVYNVIGDLPAQETTTQTQQVEPQVETEQPVEQNQATEQPVKKASKSAKKSGKKA